jgi:hypothetical protein
MRNLLVVQRAKMRNFTVVQHVFDHGEELLAHWCVATAEGNLLLGPFSSPKEAKEAEEAAQRGTPLRVLRRKRIPRRRLGHAPNLFAEV